MEQFYSFLSMTLLFFNAFRKFFLKLKLNYYFLMIYKFRQRMRIFFLQIVDIVDLFIKIARMVLQICFVFYLKSFPISYSFLHIMFRGQKYILVLTLSVSGFSFIILIQTHLLIQLSYLLLNLVRIFILHLFIQLFEHFIMFLSSFRIF